MFHTFVEGNQPLFATAIHNGHDLRPEVAERMVLDEATRLREEDPYTGKLIPPGGNQLVVNRSRFEVDVNRPRDRAVYILPEDAWGLTIWAEPPAEEIVARSLEAYDAFYSEMHKICSRMEKEFGHFVVLDLHSYNHRREGPGGPAADPAKNPEINIGTGEMNRKKWAGLVKRFCDDMRAFDYFGRNLDVRENVKFRGGRMSRWIHEKFPASGCALAIEFKKFFMDEWTGAVDEEQLTGLGEALRSAVPGILEEMETIGSKG